RCNTGSHHFMAAEHVLSLKETTKPNQFASPCNSPAMPDTYYFSPGEGERTGELDTNQSTEFSSSLRQ
ncbi:hypothetical protein, partial [Litoreibacter halocynthiae]|uniref:hypothetical protein n=1 Tax=Litoreibacter halocynthiae TaxID=1242689 RepID=UPI00248FE93D